MAKIVGGARPDTIRRARALMGLGREDFASAVGISTSMLDMYERGARRGVNPTPVEVPRTVELAVAAVVLGATDLETLIRPSGTRLRVKRLRDQGPEGSGRHAA